MTPAEKKQVRSIIHSLIEVHNLQEAGIVSHLTFNRANKVTELHGKDLMNVASYLAEFAGRERVKWEVVVMLMEIEAFVIKNEQGKPCVNYSHLTQHLINNGFSDELFCLSYEELLEAHAFITRLHEANMIQLSYAATHNLLNELSIPVISERRPRKKRNNETSNEGTTK